MTDKELAQRTREILMKRGWQPGVGCSISAPVCLAQAIGQAVDAALDLGAPAFRRDERVDRLIQALGFEDRRHAVVWNDAQTSVEAIFERLDRVGEEAS